MSHTSRQAVLYSEEEAAQELGVSRSRLHQVLDEHIFNDGSLRPPTMTFQFTDLLLLEYWLQHSVGANVLPMPKRNK